MTEQWHLRETPRFAGRNLDGENLSERDLHNCDFTNASLRNASLRWSSLASSSLFRADFTGADLRDMVLERTDLRNAVLREADLRGLGLIQGARLDGADLRGADIDGSDLAHAIAQSAPRMQGGRTAPAAHWARFVLEGALTVEFGEHTTTVKKGSGEILLSFVHAGPRPTPARLRGNVVDDAPHRPPAAIINDTFADRIKRQHDRINGPIDPYE